MVGSKDAYADVLEGLRHEFVDEAEDNLNEIEIMLENVRLSEVDGTEAMVKIQRWVHSLKGSASVADFPLVAVIMHRLEDYLSSVSSIDEKLTDDIQKFIDKGREYSSIDIDHKSIEAAEFVRQLPTKYVEKEEGREVKPISDIEVLLVIKEKMAGKIFERELSAEGLRVNTVRGSFDAIEMAVRTRPNLIICSGVIDILSGVDVANAIDSMPKTSGIPVCILTSFDKGHSELAGLSDGVTLIQKANMKEDLAQVLKKIGS